MRLPDPTLIDLHTGRLAYRRGGAGPALLLVHGWGGSSRHWLGAFALLAAHHDVIALDLPGFGASPPPAAPVDLASLAATVAALCDALGLRQTTVVGHSLGAAVATLLAARRPDVVARLALASFGLPRTPAEAALMWGLHLQLRAGAALWSPWLALWSPWLAASRPMRAAAWTTPPLPALVAAPMLHRAEGVPYAALALGAEDLAAMDARAGVEAASTAGDLAVAAAARQVAAPVLVISGRQDPLFPPASARSLAAALPGAELLLLDRCGHIPMAEAPGPFYAALGAFAAG